MGDSGKVRHVSSDAPAAAGEPVLEARGLSRVYHTDAGKVWALRGVNLAIPRGAFLAVMGPSGCGKTTLLALLGGLERPSGGQVLLAGRDLATLDERGLTEVRRRHIGFVFQAFYLLEHLTALENAALPGRFLGLSAKLQREKAEYLLREVGLADRMHHFPRQLSGGQQQRVAIARALMNDPDVVLADEPTGNLDDEATRSVVDVFRRLNEAGHTFVVATHDPRVAEAARHRVRLAGGAIRDSTLEGEPGLHA